MEYKNLNNEHISTPVEENDPFSAQKELHDQLLMEQMEGPQGG